MSVRKNKMPVAIASPLALSTISAKSNQVDDPLTQDKKRKQDELAD
jgi:hypothetical protein